MNLHLIHTNDVHSHLDHYLKVATQIRRLRESLLARGETVFLFDIGDHADRMYPETEGTMGLVNASLLKAMQYDAWVFGNNEGLIIPRQHWEALCKMSATPVVTANLRDLDTGGRFPFFQDTLVIERNGVKVGVFGVTAPFNDYYHMEGTHALDPLEQIPGLVRQLRMRGAEIVILLSHLGLSVDRKLAGMIEGVDIILGSHTHNVLEQPERAGGLWIAQAGKFAQYFGHLVIDFDEAGRRVRGVSGGVIPRDEAVPADPDLQQILEAGRRQAEQVMDRMIVWLPERLDHHFHTESELGNLVADEMRKVAEAELALLNTGVFLFGLEPGPLTRRQLLACCPSPINPVLVELSGRQIRSVLQKALDPAYTHRRGMGFGFRGKEVGSLALSGLRVTHDAGGQIERIEAAGQLIDDDRNYRVVTADYLLFSGVYEELAGGEKIRIEPFFLRELIEQALRDPANIGRAKVRRWQQRSLSA
ncbi:bifunctional metallophosphatase/5'-nucleotidase [Effusibacillus pohliae]|uniref:bifunctional metallophosphatase/5'-nucleotidase n=1 Tax=Effusibacillus pohliae TaxID=232270 RepID=UPI0003646B1A|nr:bifunctional UDP-sugar hydrolase/5'-nucleotidase [Effusibacillus pohliae]